MAARASEHVEQLLEALRVLGISWRPDAVADDEGRAVMLATALLGAAEAHLVGAELDARQVGADLEAMRQAYGPVRDEVVSTTSPAEPDPERLLLMLRTSMLLNDLSRAAGPDEQHPDVESFAGARDAVACASALLGYHYSPTFGDLDDLPEQREFLALAADMVRQLADRLVRIARSGAAD